MPDSTLAKKLQIKPGQRVAVLNAPPAYLEQLEPLPGRTELTEQPTGPCDFVQLFVKDRAELDRLAPAALAAIKRDAVFWISYPKQNSKVKTDLTRDRGWEPIHQAGLIAVSQVAIDDTWSALRFRPVELTSRGKAT